MALAESNHVHEAEAAMHKAHQLMVKYNMDEIDLSRKKEFTSVFLGKPALHHTRDHYQLSQLLMDFYFVQGIWVSTYVVEKNKPGRVLEITGTPVNIKIASHAYHQIVNYMEIQWRQYNQSKKLNRHRKTDFKAGIIQGFRSKLSSRTEDSNAGTAAREIICRSDPGLTEHMAYKYPRTSRIKRNTSNQDRGIFKDGMGAGKKLVISKGIRDIRNTSDKKKKRGLISAG
jgi:hypothetical protein